MMSIAPTKFFLSYFSESLNNFQHEKFQQCAYVRNKSFLKSFQQQPRKRYRTILNTNNLI